MNKSKKIILLSGIILLIAIITIIFALNNNKNYEKESDSYKTLYITSTYDMLKDISDINVLKEDAHQIVIAKVDKIEGCTNYNEKTGNYTRINTLGNIEVLQVLKGDLTTGTKVPFIRGGGTISYKEYEKSFSLKEKKAIAEKKYNFEYVNQKANGDIDIEEGKTYLMFLYYDDINERYEIMAYQYGLREYDINTKQVMDNDTKQMKKIHELGL